MKIVSHNLPLRYGFLQVSIVHRLVYLLVVFYCFLFGPERSIDRAYDRTLYTLTILVILAVDSPELLRSKETMARTASKPFVYHNPDNPNNAFERLAEFRQQGTPL